MGKLALNINKKVFAAAKEKLSQGFDEDSELEPGRYNGTVDKIDVTPDGDSVIFRVLVPEANNGKGGRVSVWFNVADPERAVWLFRCVDKFGYDSSAMEASELATVLDEIAEKKPTIRIRCTHKGGYVNNIIDSVLDAGGESAPAAAPAKAAATKAAPAKATKAAPAPAAAAEEEEAVADEEAVVEEEPAADEKEVDLKPGMKLFATVQGTMQPVEIVELHEAEQKVTVKLKDGKKFKVALGKLSIDGK